MTYSFLNLSPSGRSNPVSIVSLSSISFSTNSSLSSGAFYIIAGKSSLRSSRVITKAFVISLDMLSIISSGISISYSASYSSVGPISF